MEIGFYFFFYNNFLFLLNTFFFIICELLLKQLGKRNKTRSFSFVCGRGNDILGLRPLFCFFFPLVFFCCKIDNGRLWCPPYLTGKNVFIKKINHWKWFFFVEYSIFRIYLFHKQTIFPRAKYGLFEAEIYLHYKYLQHRIGSIRISKT